MMIKGMFGKFVGTAAGLCAAALVPWLLPIMFAWTLFLVIRAIRSDGKASKLKWQWGLSMMFFFPLALAIRILGGT